MKNPPKLVRIGEFHSNTSISVYLLGLTLWNLSCLEFKFDDTQQGRELAVRKQQKKVSILPILFLCQKECLVSSNLNSKQLRFHSVRPNIDTLQELALPEDNAAGHGVSESGYCGHLRPALKFDVSTGPSGGPWRIVNDYSATHHRVLAE